MSIRVLLPAATLLTIVLLAGAAFAFERGGERERGPRSEGPGHGRIVYGEITQIDSSQIVVEPRIPELLKQRMAERGRELPELPDEISIGIDENTEFYRDSAAADASAFGAGDIVVIVRSRGDGGPGAASKVADEQTAWQFIQQRMEARGRLREHMRPVFGEITALSADAVTIRFEIPDFVQAMMDARGIEPPADMPESVTLALAERTRFAQDGELVDDNPFEVGDHVALMAGPGREGEAAVWVMSDYASAQARMEEMRERFGEDGPGNGPDSPRGRRGRHGGQHGSGNGPGPAQNQE